ncbi:cuticle protein 19-like [Uranotaenia lowii]|uniref:cuticle protein 19-like n=1 Tax=Uranotaenia lowii TaxID=190385 RepID=UPI0024785AF8|nr:cuticle protein 19-like [Uranotaenia lowii]
MFRQSIVVLALFGAVLALEHHGFVSEVKHVPYKWLGGMMQQDGYKGAVEGGLGGSQQGGKDYYAYPKYKFEYGVKDYKTGDHKSQWEMRDGDVVKGEYTLDEADGTKRIVSYRADDKHGFEAKVQNIGHPHQQMKKFT